MAEGKRTVCAFRPEIQEGVLRFRCPDERIGAAGGYSMKAGYIKV